MYFVFDVLAETNWTQGIFFVLLPIDHIEIWLATSILYSLYFSPFTGFATKSDEWRLTYLTLVYFTLLTVTNFFKEIAINNN